MKDDIVYNKYVLVGKVFQKESVWESTDNSNQYVEKHGKQFVGYHPGIQRVDCPEFDSWELAVLFAEYGDAEVATENSVLYPVAA